MEKENDANNSLEEGQDKSILDHFSRACIDTGAC